MKKKLMALLLVGVMSMSMLAGCSDASETPESAAADEEETEEVEEEAAEETEEAAEEAEEAASEIDDPVFMEFEAGETYEYAPDWTYYDELINAIYVETDLEEREAMMHEAEDILMATGAIIPIYYYNDVYLKNPSIEGDYATVYGTKYFMYSTMDGENMDVFRINLASEPDYLDPALNSSVDGACLAANSFAGLYTYDENGDIVPALADGDPVVSDDGLTYTITLKEDLYWSNGDVLNANDFVYSWKRAADPATAADYAYLFVVFEGYGDGTDPDLAVEALDDNTIEFTLAAPCTYMLDLLTFPTFMPVHQASVEAADPDGTNPGAWAQEAGFVSNGAYTLTSWSHNESMVYEANPYYYDAENVTCASLEFMLSADDTAIYAAYQAGDIDYADTIPTNEMSAVKDTEDYHCIDNLGTYYIGFNVNSEMFEGKTATEAALMRRAIGLLIDRQYIIDTIAQSNQVAANSFISPGASDGNGGEFKVNDDAYTYPYEDEVGYYSTDVDVDMAIALLEEAGFIFDEDGTLSDETPIHINYLTNESTAHEAIAQSVQQDLAVIGITMDISVEDWQTFLNDRKSGNFDVAREGWLMDYNDPINMLEMFLSSSGNNDMQLGK